jgi:hypothetical protein
MIGAVFAQVTAANTEVEVGVRSVSNVVREV